MGMSSSLLLIVSVVRINSRYGHMMKPLTQYVDKGTSPDPIARKLPVLTLEVTTPFILEPYYVPETPKRVESVVSPRAETTPSDFSQAHWFAESTTSDLESESEQWYYQDLRGYLQGPFPSELMRRWYLAGFLMDDLLVSNRGDEPETFTTIAHLKAIDRHGNQIPF